MFTFTRKHVSTVQWRKAHTDLKMSKLSESGAQNLAQMAEKHRTDQTRVCSPRMQRFHCNQVFVNSEVYITLNKLAFGYFDSLKCIDKDTYDIFMLKYCRTAFIHHFL